MNTIEKLQQRDARDQLTQLLGFGESAPIQNISLQQNPVSTAHGQAAQIQLQYSQRQVNYRLSLNPCTSNSANNNANSHSGNGGPLVLSPGMLNENATFHICAAKATQNWLPLLTQARVRVGLNLTLDARILLQPENRISILDTRLDSPFADTEPRLAPFGTRISVAIDNAQQGILYQLQNENGQPLSTAVRGLGPGQDGNKQTLLHSQPLHQDSMLRISARHENDGRENDASEAQWLNIRLPIKIMPDPQTQIEPIDGPILPFASATRLRISNSQPTVHYQVYARNLHDQDYRPQNLSSAPIDTQILKVARNGQPALPIALPQAFIEGRVGADWQAVGTSQQGNGNELLIDIPATDQDRLLFVLAHKSHTRANSEPIQSSLLMHSANALLYAPDTSPALSLQLNLDNKRLSLHGGQPGVYYYLRPKQQAGNELHPPAYVHRRQPNDASLNKGIGNPQNGGLAIGIDFAIARDAENTNQDIRRDPPPAPRLPANRFINSNKVFIRAVKAQTGIVAELAQPVNLSTDANDDEN